MANTSPGAAMRQRWRKSAAHDVAVAMAVKVALLAGVLALAGALASRPRVTAATTAADVAGIQGSGAAVR
ncbi:MAG: hypothetical protein JSR15_07610 [Proteobacteria bacterium]|nr:hypothetical protein [Pseudomonadota bacterium]